MQRSLRKKLNAIENNSILPRPKLGSTKICIDDPREDALFEQAKRIIMANPEKTINDLTPEEFEIVDTASHILWVRAIDVFRTVVGNLICKGNKWIQSCFDMWLCYFIDEATTGLTQMLNEDIIFSQKGKSWKQKEKELDGLFGPNSEKWVKVFTRERFNKYIRDFIEKGINPKLKKKLAKARRKKETS